MATAERRLHDRTALVLGGASSRQGEGRHYVDAYAVAAAQAEDVGELERNVDELIRHWTGISSPDDVELHAKSIWNGSERKRGPFHDVEHKEAMKRLLFDLVNTMAESRVTIVVSVSPVPHPVKATKPDAITEWLHIYGALSRLDRNLAEIMGSHLGHPDFYLDPEASAVMRRHAGPESRAIAESGSVDVKWPGGFERFFDPAIDPEYVTAPSHANRLMQAADLAAYLFGKYIVLHSRLLEQLTRLDAEDETLFSWMSDCNFCFQCCETLDVEAVLPVQRAVLDRAPDWAKLPLRKCNKAFDDGFDLVNCSLRESARADHDGRATLNGIGWWTIVDDHLALGVFSPEWP